MTRDNPSSRQLPRMKPSARRVLNVLLTADGGGRMTTAGAPRAAMREGYQPSRYTLRKWRAGQSYETAIGALLRKSTVDDNGCWIWHGALNHHGYGVIRHWQFGSGLAHRFAWFVFHGLVASGLILDHLCRVRHCVNPTHLEPVTMRENVRRSPLVIRSHCIHGHLYAPENTITRKSGWRECRTCVLARQRAWRRDALRREVA